MSCNSCESNCNSACSYTTLNDYYGGAMANSYGLMNPLRNAVGGVEGVNTYVVPAWPYRPTYDTLVKGNTCGGYPNIQMAYGIGAENCCPKYMNAPCDCKIKCRPCQNDVIACACNPDTSAPQYMPKPVCGGGVAGAAAIVGPNGNTAVVYGNGYNNVYGAPYLDANVGAVIY